MGATEQKKRRRRRRSRGQDSGAGGEQPNAKESLLFVCLDDEKHWLFFKGVFRKTTKKQEWGRIKFI